MSTYKIIASDLDGTLLNGRSEISRENLEAIRQICERGVVFAPCTGRTYAEIPANIREIPSVRYVIHSNGTVVYDKESGKRIRRCISTETAGTALDIIHDYEAHITVRQDGRCFVDAECQDEASFARYNIIEAHRVCVRDFAEHLHGFEETVRSMDDVEIISVFFHDYEEKLRCRERLEQTGKLKTVEASEFNLEIMNVEAGKGAALHSLADMLGVSCEETIGVGDSDNDNSLLRAAGLGLAVSNSCESLKAVADELICSNEEHVIRYIQEHYL